MQKRNRKHCEVCHLQISRNASNCKATEVLQCKTCEIVCHRYCYYPGAKADEFQCQVCLHYQQDKPGKVHCLYCHDGKGIMKRLGMKKYGHVLCLAFSNNFVVKDYSSLTFIEIQSKHILETSRRSGKCNICSRKLNRLEKKGLNFCCVKNCKQRAHTVCAFAQCQNFMGENGWNWKRKNTKKWYNSLFCSYISEHHPEISELIWTKSPQQKQLALQNKESSLSVICSSHNRARQVPCICGEVLETTWVQCDNCHQWSHTKCQKTTIEEVNQNQEAFFKCYQCAVWQRIVNQNLRPLCQKYPSLHFYDFVYIHLFYQKQQYKLSKSDRELVDTLPIPPSLIYYSKYCDEVIYPLVKDYVNIPKEVEISQIVAKCEEEGNNSFDSKVAQQISINQKSLQVFVNNNNSKESLNKSQVSRMSFQKTLSLLRILFTQNFEFEKAEEIDRMELIEKFRKKYMEVNDIAIRIEANNFGCTNQGKGILELQPLQQLSKAKKYQTTVETLNEQHLNLPSQNQQTNSQPSNSHIQSITYKSSQSNQQMMSQSSILESENNLKVLCKVQQSPIVRNFQFVKEIQVDQHLEPMMFFPIQEETASNRLNPNENSLPTMQKPSSQINSVHQNNPQSENFPISIPRQTSIFLRFQKQQPLNSKLKIMEEGEEEESPKAIILKQNKHLTQQQQDQSLKRICSLHASVSKWSASVPSNQQELTLRFKQDYQSNEASIREKYKFFKRMVDIKQYKNNYEKTGFLMDQNDLQVKIMRRCIAKWLNQDEKTIKKTVIQYKMMENIQKKVGNWVEDLQFGVFIAICQFFAHFFCENQENLDNVIVSLQKIKEIQLENQLQETKIIFIQQLIRSTGKYEIKKYKRLFQILKNFAVQVVNRKKNKTIGDISNFQLLSISYHRFEINQQWLGQLVQKTEVVEKIFVQIRIEDFFRKNQQLFIKNSLKKALVFCCQENITFRKNQIEKYLNWHAIYEQYLNIIPNKIVDQANELMEVMFNRDKKLSQEKIIEEVVQKVSIPHFLVFQQRQNWKVQQFFNESEQNRDTEEQTKVPFYELQVLCKKMEESQFPKCLQMRLARKLLEAGKNQIKKIESFLHAFSQRINNPKAETEIFSKMMIYRQLDRLEKGKFNFQRHIAEVKEILEVEQVMQLARIKAMKNSAFNKYRDLSEKLLVIPFQISEGIVKQEISEHYSSSESMNFRSMQIFEERRSPEPVFTRK